MPPPTLPALDPDKSTSGIAVDPKTLDRVVPATKRNDGTVRKEIKIRPGFTPQEDVTRFRGTRQADMDRTALPKGHIIGWAPPPTSSASANKAGEKPLSKAAKKNAKRAEKKKEKRDEERDEEERDLEAEKAAAPDRWDDDDDEEDDKSKEAPKADEGKEKKEKGKGADDTLTDDVVDELVEDVKQLDVNS